MQFETAFGLLRHKIQQPITSRDRFLSLACKIYQYQHKTKHKLEQKPMKPWFNVNVEPLTCIITRGNSVKVARSQT